MVNRSRPFRSLILLAAAAAVFSIDDQVAAANLSPEDLYECVAPSVVTIIVKDENREPIASGSGFLIEMKYGPQINFEAIWPSDWCPVKPGSEPIVAQRCAYVLTNYHVMRPAVFADVEFLTGETGYVHQVEAEDEQRDLILLRVHVSGRYADQGHLPQEYLSHPANHESSARSMRLEVRKACAVRPAKER
jgi:S1-C subfamily serine protease